MVHGRGGPARGARCRAGWFASGVRRRAGPAAFGICRDNGSSAPSVRRRARSTGLGAVVAALLAGCAAPGGSDSDVPDDPSALALTLENIYRGAPGGVSGAEISPDGAIVAITADGPDGRGIYRLDLSDPAATLDLWVEGSGPVWSPDSRTIAFRRDGQVWRVGLDGAEPSQVTRDLEGARGWTWSPDGETIALYSTRSGSQDIWLVAADGSGEPRQLTESSMTADEVRFEPAWSPDGSTIAYVANKADYWSDDVWLVDVATGRERRLTRTLRAISTTPAWSPDGSRIALLGTKKGEYWYLDIADIYLLDPAGGPEVPLDMEVYATAYRFEPFWSGDGSRLYFTYQERGEHHMWSVPTEGGVATRVTNTGGVMRGVSASSDASRFAFVRSSATEGGEAWVVDAAGGPPRRLTELAPRWSSIVSPIEVSYRSFDGLYVQGFLYLPDEIEAGASCPALVQVHGGGTNSYLAGQNLTEQYLASKGFVVLAINYRGGSGFGRGFQDLGDEDWLNGMAYDPGAAADYLRALPYVNGRVGIYGYSYGGMQSMAAITRTPDKFAAAAPMAGIYSQRQTFEHQDRLGRVFTVDGHGGLPEERPDIYEKSETVARISNITAPVLIQHGERDVRAPFLNFELAVAELERHGIEYEAHTYPEGHGFRDPQNRIDLYRRVEEWFTRHLGRCTDDGA
ncbi:MAG: prolyl oligopeptidase family serine peptidase [Gemmatimonadetes bacterium]|nr:prolyl oligopeptidase family serine peptidase [Gemmatimonadota bacterium]